ncbi:MAG: hypothetical protein AAGA57_03705, partial [Planctomycetota bacterium]
MLLGAVGYCALLVVQMIVMWAHVGFTIIGTVAVGVQILLGVPALLYGLGIIQIPARSYGIGLFALTAVLVMTGSLGLPTQLRSGWISAKYDAAIEKIDLKDLKKRELAKLDIEMAEAGEDETAKKAVQDKIKAVNESLSEQVKKDAAKEKAVLQAKKVAATRDREATNLAMITANARNVLIILSAFGVMAGGLLTTDEDALKPDGFGAASPPAPPAEPAAPAASDDGATQPAPE